MIRDPWLRALVIVMCAIAGIYLVGLVWQVLQQFADILLLFFLAWLLAFVLEPVVAVLVERGRLPRLLAIGVTYLTLLVVLATGIIVLVPALTEQIGQVVKDLPTYADQVAGWTTQVAQGANAWLLDRGSPVVVDARAALDPAEMARRIEALGPPLLNNAVQLATGAATLLLASLLAVILSFYFMVDGARLAEALITALPPRAQDDTRFLVANIHRAFAGFLRGQVIQALLSGVGTGLLMAALSVDYALLASVIAGLMFLIPFIGPVVALWLPVTIALLTHPTVAPVLFIALLALQQAIFHVLAPRIMSRQVGLHPLLVFFAVLAGARVAGIWGAIFGVPVVAVLAAMASFYRAGGDERVARLQEQLPGHDLVSVEPAASVEPTPQPPAAADAPAASPRGRTSVSSAEAPATR